jgi:tRNA(His) guanylyltransferase
VDVQESMVEGLTSLDFAAEEADTPIPTQTPSISTKAKRKEKPKRPYDGTSGDIIVLHEDIIRDGFWNDRPWLLQ